MFKAARSAARSVGRRSTAAATSVDDGKDGLSVAPAPTIFDGAGGNQAAVEALGLAHAESTEPDSLFLDAASTGDGAGLAGSGGGSGTFSIPSMTGGLKKAETAHKLADKTNTAMGHLPGMGNVTKPIGKGLGTGGNILGGLKLVDHAGEYMRGRGDSDKEADAVNKMVGTAGGMAPGPAGPVFGAAHNLATTGSKAAQKSCAFGVSRYTGRCMDASDDATETGFRARDWARDKLSPHVSNGAAEVMSHVAGLGATGAKSVLNAVPATAYGVKDVVTKHLLVPQYGEIPDVPDEQLDAERGLRQNERWAAEHRELEEDARAMWGDPETCTDTTLRPPPEDPYRRGYSE